MRRGACACLLLVPVAPAAVASCGLQQLGLALQHADSRWAEFDASGRRLLHERGRLPGAGFELRAACSAGPALELRGQRQQGGRDYQGHSSQGQALSTTAELRETRLQAQLWQPLAAPLGLDVGLMGEWSQIDRKLADAGAVRGYPERHRRAQLGLGLRLHGEFGPGWQYMLQGEWAFGPAGRLHLELPIADPVDLPSGRLRRQLGLRLHLQWSLPEAPAWQLRAGLGWRQHQLSEGEMATLWRAGNAVGGARQPRTQTQEWVPELALIYRF